MTEFRYKAKSGVGRDVTGVIAANSAREVRDILANQKLFPISIDAVGKGEINLSKLLARRPPGREIAAFLHQLAELLENGVPVLTAFEVLAKQTTHPLLKEAVTDIKEQIADGHGIDEAFESHLSLFGDLTVSVIQAGAEGAFLEDSLKRTAQFLERQAELRGKVVGAMIYPSILLVVGFLVVSVLLVFFVPKFQPMFETLVESGHPLPLVTVSLLWVRGFAARYGLIVVVLLFALIIWLRVQMATRRGRRIMDVWKLKLPIIGPVALNSATAKLCRVLGTLLQNGVPILRALEISSRSTGNMVLTDAVNKSAENVAAGEPLSKPLTESGIIPTSIMTMISIAEESNTLESVLVNAADSLEQQLSRKLDVMVRFLEPLMLLIMATAVFYIMIALLLPVFQMTQAV
ncbi:MAG: type II secretion system F family protein [Planctomycetia bacterium]|nr:type II secretion system F family protein [Planctomycetia bacterium]